MAPGIDDHAPLCLDRDPDAGGTLAGCCSGARVAIGAVAPTVLLVPDAAAALVGSRGEDAALTRAGAAASAASRPISDKRGTADYRRKIAGVLVRRAATAAFERARGGGSA